MIFAVEAQERQQADELPSVLSSLFVPPAEHLLKAPDRKLRCKLLDQPFIQATGFLIAPQPFTRVNKDVAFDSIM